MPQLKTPDPKLYVLTPGYIELTEAVFQNVKLLFGTRHASKFSGEAELRNELALPKKQRRDRRWNLVRRCFVRAFRQNRLTAYLLTNGNPEPLDAAFWREPSSATLPFGTAPLGREGLNTFVLKTNEWQDWANRASPKSPSTNILSENLLTPVAPIGIQPNKRGPKPRKHNATKDRMIDDLRTGKTTPETLTADTGENLANQYDVSRNTATKARDKAIIEFQAKKTLTISDK